MGQILALLSFCLQAQRSRGSMSTIPALLRLARSPFPVVILRPLHRCILSLLLSTWPNHRRHFHLSWDSRLGIFSVLRRVLVLTFRSVVMLQIQRNMSWSLRHIIDRDDLVSVHVSLACTVTWHSVHSCYIYT